MKPILGFFMIIGGIILGFYVGLWICFVGGLWTLIQMVTGAVPLAFGTFAWAVIKIALSGLFGYLSAIILVLPGMVLLED